MIDIKDILKKHKKWIQNNFNGERADLSGANLSRADLIGVDLRKADLSGANLSGADLRKANLIQAYLSGADLSGVNLDFSSIPFHCGSFDMIVDRKIAIQILFHFVSLDCDDEKIKQIQQNQDVVELCKQFHRDDVDKDF